MIFLRLASLIYAVSDIPLFGCLKTQPALFWPQPIRSGTKWRWNYFLIKLVSITIFGYFLIIILNICLKEFLQLEFSIICVFTISQCMAKFSICKETVDIDQSELCIINSVLTKNHLKIENGDLFHLVSESPSQPTYPPTIIPHLQPTIPTPTGPTSM